LIVDEILLVGRTSGFLLFKNLPPILQDQIVDIFGKCVGIGVVLSWAVKVYIHWAIITGTFLWMVWGYSFNIVSFHLITDKLTTWKTVLKKNLCLLQARRTALLTHLNVRPDEAWDVGLMIYTIKGKAINKNDTFRYLALLAYTLFSCRPSRRTPTIIDAVQKDGKQSILLWLNFQQQLV